jgi:hypothetical protein
MAAPTLDVPVRLSSDRRTVARAGAAGLVAGGLLFAAEGVADFLRPGYPLAQVLGPALVLIIAGYVGYGAVQHERTGRLGAISLAVVLVCFVMDVGYKFGLVPESVVTWFVLGLTAGSVGYAVATWRARVLPRWAAPAFVVLLPLPMVEGLGTATAGLLFAALGVALWRTAGPATAAAPVA